MSFLQALKKLLKNATDTTTRRRYLLITNLPNEILKSDLVCDVIGKPSAAAMRSAFIRHSDAIYTCILLLFGALASCRGSADDVSPYQKKGVGLTTSGTSALLWQGFHFQWLREVVGFETPHRLGSVASYITNTTECYGSRSCHLSGNYTVQFSPGVDGDYAFPIVYYAGFASGNGSQVHVLSGNWSFTFQDNSSSEPVPHSDTLLHFNVSMVLQEPLSASQAVEVSLQGFQIKMRCIETPEHSCNSNAIWPYHFNLSFAGLCQDHAQGKVNGIRFAVCMGNYMDWSVILEVR